MEMEMVHGAKSRIFTRGLNGLRNLAVKLKEKCVGIAKNIKKLAKDDPRRVIHSLKMALALTLVSLFYFVRPLYEGFGVSGMWAVLTVVVVFEFSVGATISKGLNRGLATLTAGALGVGAQHLAVLFGTKGEPIVLGILVFLLASMSTFTRFVPSIKKRYDYGVLIFILTFSLVAVSGYRVDVILVLAYQRLSTIIVGGATCMIVSIFICPVWAGEDLHNLIAGNLEKLAKFMEGFGEDYFTIPDNDKISMNSKKDGKSYLQSHKSILASKTNEENLANFARWEPCHGQFRLRHPWKQYVKVGALARQCAYHIETLCGFINTEAKVPMEFRRKIKDSCTKMSIELSKALRAMASSIEKMAHPKQVVMHIENSKQAAKELENVLKTMLYGPEDIIALVPDATVASILVNITTCVEKISEAVHELAKVAHFKEKVEATVSPEPAKHTAKLHRGIVNPMYDEGDRGEVDYVEVIVCDQKPQKIENCIEGEIRVDNNMCSNNVNNSIVISPPSIITCT
ncbi:aluminum-activated malate transporter 8-like [Chenopodium quinoa]|uniref:aluminum-activated malate transporter 8-like n=1 Tax=Chenopodium quinoa TaxID=63459 RepID=UPI000B7922F2|nr:aluminum-activated malate transporter 8-like [Chenopodium quinoa]